MNNFSINSIDIHLLKTAYERKTSQIKGTGETSVLFSELKEDINTMLKIGMDFLSINLSRNAELEVAEHNLLIFKQNGHLLPFEFLKEVETMPTINVYIFCFKLLVRYHFSEKRQNYLTSAVKFYSNAIQLIDFRSIDPNVWIKKLNHYTDIIKEANICEILILVIIDTLCQKQDLFHEFCTSRAVFPKILRILRKNKTTFLGINSEHNSFGRVRPSNLCLIRSPRNFSSLMEIGDKNIFSLLDYEYLKVSTIMQSSSLKGCISRVPDTVKFRVYQVFNLYLCSLYESPLSLLSEERLNPHEGVSLRIHKTESPAVHALKRLWSSIPDSFLILDDFMQIEETYPNPREHFHKAFKWYDEHVTKGTVKVKQPRDLQHMGRCAIRWSLGFSMSFPEGLYQLILPTELKNYLSNIDEPLE